MTVRRRIPVSIATIATLAALPAGATAATPHHRAVQSKPVRVSGPLRAVVGQAAITGRGRLIVRLAVPGRTGHGGARVLARTSRRIPAAVSNPAKSQPSIALTRNGQGIVIVIGPLNHTQPDSVLFRLRWRAGPQPSIRITKAEV